MKAYIGCKIIKAKPMTNLAFDEDIKGLSPTIIRQHYNVKEGYCVEYPDGYMSWSPKEVFEAAYREISEAEKDLI